MLGNAYWVVISIVNVFYTDFPQKNFSMLANAYGVVTCTNSAKDFWS